jgi:predicted anti-sigma-YlaC factor YlaD
MMKTCRETSLLLSRSLDERLTWYQRAQVRMHLLICDACRHFERQMLLVRRACAEVASGRRPAPHPRTVEPKPPTDL